MKLLSLELGKREGENEPPSRKVSTVLPRVWIGYLLILGSIVVVVAEGLIDPSTLDEAVTLPSLLASLACFAYWLYCVYRLHQVLREATGGLHPISPIRSVVGHLLPVYNLVFLFRWPNALANFVNTRLPTRKMWKGWAGAIFLCGLMVSKFFDSAVGEAIMFSILLYLKRQVAAVLEGNAALQPAT